MEAGPRIGVGCLLGRAPPRQPRRPLGDRRGRASGVDASHPTAPAQRLACEEWAWLMNRMRCNLASRQLTPMLIALAMALHGGAAYAVQLRISSANVAQAGG